MTRGISLLELLALVAMLALAPTAAGEPVTRYFRESTFQLPFRVDRGPLGAIAGPPAAVQLHVSSDAGRTWKLYATSKPEDRAFAIRVAADGEYLFCVRSVAGTTTLRPPLPLEPELRVIVDTAPPRLELDALSTATGQITVRWRTTDPALDLSSFRIQYQAEGATDPWQPVSASPPASDAMDADRKGEVSFIPKLNAPRALVKVRAEVSDRAGNLSIEQMNVDWVAPAAGPIASATPPGVNAAQIKGAVWPVDETTSRPLGAPAPQVEKLPEPESTAAALAPRQPLLERAVAPPVASQVVAPLPPTEAAVPAGDRPFMVNSLRFELDYELQSVGPSGVARIEIWVSRDAGRTWALAGTDDDRQSPYLAAGDQEGLYGFRIVIVGGNGLQTESPLTGDLPEITIGVDLTPPAVRFTSAQQTSMAEGAALNIVWEAADSRLAVRPVSLAYSQNRGGPWLPIAAGLDNTGSFAWKLDDHIPERVYLKLEIRDEAGNIGSDEPADPVVLDRLRPQGRFRAARPAG